MTLQAGGSRGATVVFEIDDTTDTVTGVLVNNNSPEPVSLEIGGLVQTFAPGEFTRASVPPGVKAPLVMRERDGVRTLVRNFPHRFGSMRKNDPTPVVRG